LSASRTPVDKSPKTFQPPEAQKILKDDPKRGMAIMAKEYPSMTAETNAEAYKTISQIWTRDGHITEAQAHGTFAYLQPKGTTEVDFRRPSPTRFCRKK
jgi:NitT/TauT family transport system substrate-binding protein